MGPQDLIAKGNLEGQEMRRRTGFIFVTLLGIALFALGDGEGVAQDDSETPSAPNETPMPIAQEQPQGEATVKETLRALLSRKGWLEYFNNEVASLLELDLDEPVNSAREEFDTNCLCRVVTVSMGTYECRNMKELRIDVVSGRLLVFHGEHPCIYSPLQNDPPPEDKEHARDKALELAKRLGVEGLSEDARVSFLGIRWEFAFDRFYRGYRCRDRTFEVSISPDGEDIIGFYERPPVYPETLVEKIDREEALEIALSFLEEVTGKPRDAIHIGEAELAITLTRGPWKKNGKQPSERGQAPVARLVWDIAFDTNVYDVFWVCIDSETGETFAPYLGM